MLSAFDSLSRHFHQYNIITSVSILELVSIPREADERKLERTVLYLLRFPQVAANARIAPPLRRFTLDSTIIYTGVGYARKIMYVSFWSA